MNFFAHTVCQHLQRQIEKVRLGKTSNRKMIVMIPAMPEQTLTAVAEAITSFCLKEHSLKLTLKIATILTQKWSLSGRQLADARGWIDEQGNLTCYRNIPEDKERFSLVVLCGADRVTDAASLADFHTCDPHMIWNTDMDQSFCSWVVAKLKSVGLHDFEDDLSGFDRIIKPILQCGRGDLLQISDWLETVNLDHAENISHAQRIMLGELQSFGLPLLARFPLQQKRKSLSLYINKSADFFSYTLFLEARQRDKAIKAVDKILKTLEDGDPVNLPLEDEDICGPYLTGEEFLNGLKKYVQSDDKIECNRLLQCDFVIIWDKILKFKTQENKEKPESVRKLTGNPVEVILTATWMALKDFYLENRSKSEIKIEEISITSDSYKHDVESGDDVEENEEQARDYLTRLIGGIDSIFLGHLNLKNVDGSEINIASSLLNSEIVYRYGKSAEPVLEFTVTIFDSESDKDFKRRFGWRLPEHHMYRLSVELLLRTRLALANLKDIHKLPVFHISYYEELLQATADEEIRRVLLHSIRDERDNKNAITNLFSGTWSNEHDAVSSRLKILAEKYDGFIQESVNSGLYSSIFAINNSWSDLRKAFIGVFEEASTLDDLSQSSVVGMLTRIFLIIQPRPERLGITWHADCYEKSGVATILHPSVIEMLEAQVVYLTRCFNYAVNKQLSGGPSKESFKAHVWRTYVDLSEIQSPLTGLLFNEQLNLDANVRGQELIHRIGNSDTSNTPLSTRLLLQYNEGTDEDYSLSDTEMFRETSESKLLLRLMQDYFDLHPHARDGLNLAVFRNKDIQPIIAAIHAYLKILATKPTAQKSNKRYILNDERRRPYAISVTLFTESNDETDVSAWVQQWKERWEAAETESKYELYRRSRFSVAHRIVEKNGLSSFQSLINQQFEADIAIFYNFIGAGEGVNRFENVEEFDVTSRDLKFPILEKACCSVNSPAEMYRRKRVVSNRQFVLGAYHANLLHSLQSGSKQKGTLVVGAGDFTPWRELIDCLHKKAEWIICVDPNMDERLIKTPSLNTNAVREIIGFGSGVGTHGEDNYTISTEQFSLADVHQRLQVSIRSLYAAEAGWSTAECDDVAKGVLRVATQLSGLSLIRATGVGDEYIRDFMAFSLSRIMLNSNEDLLCESLVSLDAYRHWFDLSDNRSRPDLLWIRAKIGADNRILVKMQLVECKMGQQSKEHISKAKSQIENGLRVLMSSFAPLNDELEDDRPDRRYWWMQLHRLIASKTEVSKPKYSNALLSLERLAEGDFEIVWEASVFAFWINKDSDIKRVGYWDAGESPAVTANIYEIGGGFVKKITTDFENQSIDWSQFDNQGNELQPEDNVDIQGDEDDDYTPWENEEEPEEEENGDYAPEVTTGDASVPTIVDEDIRPLPVVEDEVGNAFAEKQSNDDIGEGGSSSGFTGQNISVQDFENTITKLDPLSRILLGHTVAGGKPIYWEFGHPELANRHILIFGSSGQGKTYAIQCMLCEMTKFKQNSLIVDYTNGFLPNHLEEFARPIITPQQHVVSQDPLPINPFLPQISDNGGIIISENSNAVAKRIAGIFDAVYNIGDQQFSVLHRAIMDGVDSLKENMNLVDMLSIIENLAEDKKYKSSAQTLYNKLRPFVLDRPFAHGEGSFDWDSLFLKQDPLCNIFQLAGMDMHSGRLITEFILWDLYGHLQSKGKKTDPKVIVLDEVQNLDHKEGSPLSKYLREGRKFGLSLILATQTMSNLKKDERDRMFNAAHKIFFRPADTELKAFAEIAALATRERVDDWVGRLSTLKKGECYSIGPFVEPTSGKLISRPYKIRITALEERNFNEQ
jgi:DNA phosphorothioation-dependent restriction protein DptH